MKRPTEPLEVFRARINAAAETSDVSSASGSDSNWLLGYRQRHKGSLHQDIWRGTAAELANCGYLAVFPGQGWWKTRRALNRYESEARYSLIVSLHVPETDVDLLTPVQLKVDALIASQGGVLYGRFLEKNRRFQRIQQFTFSLLLIGFGVRLLMMSHV